MESIEQKFDVVLKMNWAITPVAYLDNTVCSCRAYRKTVCNAPGKHALLIGWQNIIIRDIADIKTIWNNKSTYHYKDKNNDAKKLSGDDRYNIGLLTGKVNGLIVIDIDKHTEEKNGAESLKDLENKYGVLPDTVEAITGGGGRHLFFKYPKDATIKNKASIAPGVDVRGDGGYVLIEPSKTKSEYQWELSSHPLEVELAELPQQWINLLSGPTKTEPLHVQDSDLINYYVEGNRNQSLYNLGASLRTKNMTNQEIRSALLLANKIRCKPPLDEAEVNTIVNSISKLKIDNFIPKIAMPTIPVITDIEAELNIKYLDTFINNITSNRMNKSISTGFKELDKKLNGGFRRGLYVVAANPSLGKTTFVQQIANNIAYNQTHVLFFSLEMCKQEMLSKDFSREMSIVDTSRGKLKSPTALEVEQGKFSRELLKEIEPKMEQQLQYISYIESNFDTNINVIEERVYEHVKRYGKTVVIIDYLQIIQAHKDNIQIREAIDYNIIHLKRLSKKLEIPIICISNLNRQNYLNSIGYESLKETGCLEYTADCILGLQLHAIHDIDKIKSISAKRKVNDLAKSENPRKVELQCLKNRSGLSTFEVHYLYYTEYNYFEECID